MKLRRVLNLVTILNLVTGICFLAVFVSQRVEAQATKLVKVISRKSTHVVELPGEFYPFLSVQLHAKVSGYVEHVIVDRGSVVRKGQLLVTLSAPEMMARISEARAQIASAESDESQAEAQLKAAESTYAHLLDASNTPGTVAGNHLVQAKQQAEAAQALVRARQRSVDSLGGISRRKPIWRPTCVQRRRSTA